MTKKRVKRGGNGFFHPQKSIRTKIEKSSTHNCLFPHCGASANCLLCGSMKRLLDTSSLLLRTTSTQCILNNVCCTLNSIPITGGPCQPLTHFLKRAKPLPFTHFVNFTSGGGLNVWGGGREKTGHGVQGPPPDISYTSRRFTEDTRPKRSVLWKVG